MITLTLILVFGRFMAGETPLSRMLQFVSKRVLLSALFIIPWVKGLDAQSIAWMKDAGTFSYESGKSVTTDAQGFAYVTGNLVTTSYFGSIQVPAYYDGFLAQYHSDGTEQWVTTFGGDGSADMTPTRVKCDAYGNVYVCGRFGFKPLFQEVSFDNITITATAPNQEMAFLAKYAPTGAVQWVRYGGGNPSHAIFYDLDFDAVGNIYLAGDFSDYATFDGVTIEADLTVSNAGMIVKYDPSGNVLHLSQTSINTRSELYGIEVSPSNGTVYIAGTFEDALSMNGITVTAIGGSRNVFTAAFDPSFTCQWIRHGGGNNGQYGPAVGGIELDANNQIYLTGSVSGSLVQFGPLSYSFPSIYDDRIFTLKYDAAGNEQWLKYGGGDNPDAALDIITDTKGHSTITGYLGGNVLYAFFDQDTMILSQSSHCFLARYDAAGNLLYANRMGLGNDELGTGLAHFNDTTFYLTGATQGLTVFDTLTFVASYTDPNIFLARFHEYHTGVATNLEHAVAGVPGFSMYPNPATTITLIHVTMPAAGECTLELRDAAGRLHSIHHYGILPAGEHLLQAELTPLPPGIYGCSIRTHSRYQTKILVKQ